MDCAVAKIQSGVYPIADARVAVVDQMSNPIQTGSLTKKVLILVVLPLLLQIAVMARFAWVQNTSQHQLAEARKAQATARVLNRVNGDVYVLLIDFEQSSLQKIEVANFPQLLATAVNANKQIEVDLQELKDVAGDDPEIMSLIDMSVRLKRQALALVKRLANPLTLETGEGEYRHRLAAQLNDVIHTAFFNLFPEVSKKLEKLANQQLDLAAGMSREEQTIMICCAVTDLFVTVAIALLLTRTLTTRLHKLSENTQRLARGETLGSADQGTDEIGLLDKSFRDMAVSLREAEQAKQEIVSMISHDLGTPLTTVGSIIETLSGLAATDREKNYLEMAQRNIDRVYALVRDLLDLEKARAGMLNLEATDFAVRDLFNTARQATESFASRLNVELIFAATSFMSADGVDIRSGAIR